MAIHGHVKNITWWKKDQPQVSVFTGPKSVGKWTTALSLAYGEDLPQGGVVVCNRLSAEEARSIVNQAEHMPLGEKKIFIINLDYARQTEINTLLKILETPLNGLVQFIFVTSASNLPPTLLSRARPFWFSYLSQENVAKILVDKFKKKPEKAEELAKLSGGTVDGALEAEALLEAKTSVLAALNALQERNSMLLFRQEGDWSDVHTQLLRIWCTEVITQNWKYFSEDEVLSLDRGFPIAILRGLHLDVRPRLVIHAVLNDLIRT